MGSELGGIVDKLPFKKHATTTEIVLLFVAAGLLLLGGAKIKGYFDDAHKVILDSIAKVDSDSTQRIAAVQGTVTVQEGEIASNTREINSLRHYYWSNADMQQWATKLDKANRTAGQVLVVPDVPEPPSGPH